MDKLAIINQTITKGFPWLIFPKPLEAEFQGFVRQRILNRVLPVGISAGIFVLIFCVLDWFLLHPAIAMHTSIVRIGLVLPAIIVVTLWLYFKPPRYYLWVYSATLLITSLSIIYIIWLAHVQGIDLPYEGLMIVMMYGFFIMALPFYLALSINIAMVVLYALSEPLFYLNFADYLNHVLFLSIVLVSAAIGAYVTEHNQRANFLRKRMLDIHHQQALKSIQQKNKYLAAASHDIRQPLQGIALMGDVLKEERPNDPNIEQLNQGIRSLNSMFTQMLDISKINLNLIQPKLTEFSLIQIVEQIANLFTSRLQKHDIQLKINVDPCYVYSDFTMLSRILHNLIENALNHSQCNRIWIYSVVSHDQVTLKIVDDGKGIHHELKSTLFNEFIKGQESQNGLGLGLAIVAQFCKRLHHDLEFTSQPGETTFSVRLPRAQNEGEIAESAIEKKRILLVDDDPDVLTSVEAMLKQWDYDVVSVNGIQHAMNLIKQDWYCIISDWNLSDGCGEEIIKYANDKDIPSILMSSHGGENLLSLARSYNSQFLRKPLSPSRLRAKLLAIK